MNDWRTLKNKIAYIAAFAVFAAMTLAGCFICVKYIPSYYGLIAGFGSLIMTAIFYLFFQYFSFAKIIVFVCNGFATGLAMGAYYVEKSVPLDFVGALTGAGAALVLFIVLVAIGFAPKKLAIILYILFALISLALLGLSIAAWVRLDASFYSYITFLLAVCIVFMIGFLVNEIGKTTQTLLVCSYCALVVVILIVFLILCLDGCDGCDCGGDCGGGGKNKKGNRKFNAELLKEIKAGSVNKPDIK